MFSFTQTEQATNLLTATYMYIYMYITQAERLKQRLCSEHQIYTYSLVVLRILGEKDHKVYIFSWQHPLQQRCSRESS